MESSKVKYSNSIEWQNELGERHREDGPAAEYYNGDKGWFLNGKLHREDRPAIEYTNGDKEWFLNGKYLSKEDWEKEVLKLRLKRLCELQ